MTKACQASTCPDELPGSLTSKRLIYYWIHRSKTYGVCLYPIPQVYLPAALDNNMMGFLGQLTDKEAGVCGDA